MKLLKIIFLLITIGLSGCCFDCTNTKNEYDYLVERNNELSNVNRNNEAWLNAKEMFYSKIETQRREAESAVLQARVCDYILPLCPVDMTETGRAIIAKHGTKFDTPAISQLQIGKVMLIIFGLLIGSFFTYGIFLFLIIPNENTFQKARNELENLYKRAANFESQNLEDSLKRKAELESTIQKLENKEIQITKLIDSQQDQLTEKELKVFHLKNQIAGFENDIARLKATMDAMKGF